ncbi:DUF3226 domain-containing protein [Butyrivibrio sp. WCD2001]|uniref:DUF3226 domain-containing protein n=1 Tax=Butyrivibrio sp. WCD2001 TaxID=1280681 RepID=UPI00041363A1|nr:DUF3226 domain-containing protein [Butyrivibrio sp. WCD2001]
MNKKHYLMIVEGAHDTSIVGNILKYKKWAKRKEAPSKISDVWNSIIPDKFPFNSDRYDRITPVPDFYESDNLSIAIKTAGGDSSLASTLAQTISVMEIKEQAQIDGILVLMDADTFFASKKTEAFIDELSKETTIEMLDNSVSVVGSPVKIEVKEFCFPDNKNVGNLENLLIDCGKIQYTDLLDLSNEYVSKADSLGLEESKIDKIQYKKKAIIGCMTNILKPGKANQSSILDNKWVTDETAENVEGLKQLINCLESFLGM